MEGRIQMICLLLAFDMFSTGANTDGKLGIGQSPMIIPRVVQFTPIQSKAFKSFGIGTSHVLAVSDDGKLYGWGSNANNKLLEDSTKYSQFISPHQISYFSKMKIRHADAANDHSIVVTDDGEVYTFGGNSDGQLGNKDVKKTIDTPVKITLPADSGKPIHVTAMTETSFILTSTGKVYVSGDCTNGVCGMVVKDQDLWEFTLLNFNYAVQNIFMGYQSIIMVDTSGNVYGSGDNRDRKLCISGDKDEIDVLTKIPTLFNITKASFGRNHSVFLQGSTAVGCGSGKEYQLGPQNLDIYDNPVIIDSNVDSAAATSNGTMLVKSGDLEVIGQCNIGELGVTPGIYKAFRIIMYDSKIKNIYSYIDYSFAIQDMSIKKSSMTWWGILLIVIGVLLGIGLVCWLVIWIMRNRSTLFDVSKYKKIDERSALANNQADLEAW